MAADTPSSPPVYPDPQTLLQLQGLLGLMQANPDDLKKIDSDKWLNFGLGLMQAKKGNELGAFGSAGMNAIQQANTERTQLQAQRGQNVTQAIGLLGIAKQQQALQQNDLLNSKVGGIFSGAAPAGVPPVAAAPSPSLLDTAQPPQYGMGDRGIGSAAPALPAVGGPPAVAPLASGAGNPPAALPSALAGPYATPTVDQAAKYRQAAQLYASAGKVAEAKQFSDIANSLEADYSTSPQTLMKNGVPTSVLIGKRGEVKPMDGYTPAEKAVQMNTGNAIIASDPYTLKPLVGSTPTPIAQGPDSKASNALGWSRLKEEQRHNQITEGDPVMIEQSAQAIARGDLAPLSGFALARPMGQQVMARVTQINPEYNAQDWQSQQKTLNAFTSGPPAKQVKSFNVALAHLDTLGTLADGLQNGNVQVVNKAANVFSQQTGQPLVTDFNAAKKVVGDEIVKAIVGGGGGVDDRKAAAQVLDAANSPAQLKGVIETYKTLMVGQLGGLQQQYESGTKRKDFSTRYLSPEAQNVYRAKTAGANGSDVRSAADKILMGQ